MKNLYFFVSIIFTLVLIFSSFFSCSKYSADYLAGTGEVNNPNLFELTSKIVKSLENVYRWQSGNLEPAHSQNVLEHTLEVTLLADQLAQLELELNGVKLDRYRIVKIALVHDLPEGEFGDVCYLDKNNPLLKDSLLVQEEKIYFRILDSLNVGPLSDKIIFCYKDIYYNLNSSHSKDEFIEYRFFDAVEKFEYIFFAIRECDNGNHSFVRVISCHLPKILEYTQEFKSIQYLYQIYRLKIESILNAGD